MCRFTWLRASTFTFTPVALRMCTEVQVLAAYWQSQYVLGRTCQNLATPSRLEMKQCQAGRPAVAARGEAHDVMQQRAGMHAGTAIRTHLCPVLVLLFRSNTPQLSNAYHEPKTPVPETIHNEPHDYLSLLSSLTQSLRDYPCRCTILHDY